MVKIVLVFCLAKVFSFLTFVYSLKPLESMRTKDFALFCYSCVSKYPSYHWVNQSAIVDYLRAKNINVPEANEKCNERPAIEEFPEFKEVTGVFCPLGICVKLKGVVWHPDRKIKEHFVIRHCWDKMWDKPYDVNQWYNCSDVDYMADIEGHMCSCHQDLCNRSSSMSSFTIFKLSIVFLLLLSCNYLCYRLIDL